jgi:N-acetylglutamate synthase-like GNAT family acetyltransferase
MDKPELSAWTIRRATSDDRESIQELQARLNRPSRTDSVTSEYFVAVSVPQIVACAAVRKRGNIGYLYGLVVDKPWRRQGIGHALTETRLHWLRSQNIEVAVVIAMFWNVKFFKKHDFSLTNRRSMGELERLHSDFGESWSRRSALLSVNIRQPEF